MMPVASSVVRVEISHNVRVIRILKREVIDGDEVVTGRITKQFCDVQIKTTLDNGSVSIIELTGHIYREVPKVIIEATNTKYSERESMNYDVFLKWIAKRWGTDVKHKRAKKLQKLFDEFFYLTPTPKKKTAKKK